MVRLTAKQFCLAPKPEPITMVPNRLSNGATVSGDAGQWGLGARDRPEASSGSRCAPGALQAVPGRKNAGQRDDVSSPRWGLPRRPEKTRVRQEPHAPRIASGKVPLPSLEHRDGCWGHCCVPGAEESESSASPERGGACFASSKLKLQEEPLAT